MITIDKTKSAKIIYAGLATVVFLFGSLRG